MKKIMNFVLMAVLAVCFVLPAAGKAEAAKLAVVPLAMHAPLGTIILYGQPGEGVVMLSITPAMKKRAEELFTCFEEVSTPVAREVFNI